MEVDENVFQESFGGNQNGKCAYSLIYISQNLASQLDKIPFSKYSASFSLSLTTRLKQHVAEANMKFDKELISEQGEILGNAIMDKFKQRCEILRQHCEN